MKAVQDHAETIQTSNKRVEEQSLTSVKRNILVVDDNAQNRLILCGILKSAGYGTVEADNGKTAFDLLSCNPQTIDLVFLDLIMPVMDGYTLLAKMNESGIITSVPVIVTTGYEEEDSEIRCLERGASDFLTKPYNAKLVLHRVGSLLRLWDNAALVNRLERDPLTGVFGREFFFRNAQKILDENPQSNFNIVYTDIDDFKMINARYGVEMGDALLKFFASVFTKFVGKNGICGRLGADNFAMLLRDIPLYTQEQAANLSSEELKDAPIKGVQLKYGIYPVTERELSVLDMCERAKFALSSIKHIYGMYYATYNDTVREQAMREHRLADGMERALKKREFAVYLQPKHCTESGAVAGAEALVRWNHPELGFISPAEFIPMFERNGFIAKLDRYMLTEVCKILKIWIKDGITPIPVSVNISRADFIYEDLPQTIARIVDIYELPHELIHLEVTESAYTDQPQKIISAVTALRKMGFLIEMDDFGSGYSSLNMLSELPIDILKLDMRFIQRVNSENKSMKQNVLSFILSLSKWLQLPTIAEGVETQTEFDLLKSMGCNLIQGYYYAKPMPTNDFKEYMLSHRDVCGRNEQQKTAAIKTKQEQSDENKKPLVLVVEDVESNREVMKSLLTPYYRVATAENGKVACEYITRHHEDVSCILLDLLMPVMDGFQTLEFLRATTVSSEIPVIITTETGVDNELLALHLGADNLVAKPYNSEILLHNVKKAVSEKNFWKIKREFELEKAAFYEKVSKFAPTEQQK